MLSRSAKTGIYVGDGTARGALHDFAANTFRDNGDVPVDAPSTALGGLDAASDDDPSAAGNTVGPADPTTAGANTFANNALGGVGP